jgi:hypothetical protein
MARALKPAVASALFIAALLSPLSAHARETDGRADALSYLATYNSLVVSHFDSTGRASTQTIDRSYRLCRPTLGRMTSAVETRVQDALHGIFNVSPLRPRLLAPYYIRFSAAVAARPSPAEVLRQLVSDIGATAKVARKLERLKFNLCSYLRRWRAHRWTESYVLRLRPVILQQIGISILAVERSQRSQPDRLIPPLQKLGLSFQEALEVVQLPALLP